MARLHKGDRFQVSVRIPSHLREHFQERQDAFGGIPLGDYIATRVMICEGLDITPEVLFSVPVLFRMYETDVWAEKFAELPPHVAQKVRRVMSPEELQEHGLQPPDQLAMTG